MTSPSGHPYHTASPTRPGPPRRSRRTRGILDARIKKLKAGPLANRVRAERLRRITRQIGGELRTPQSDTFSFQVAEPRKMASFFQINGGLQHIRKFVLEFDWSSPDRRLDTPEQVEPYIIAIQNLPCLEDISFEGVSIGPWAAFPLATALRTKTRLRRANFSDCFAQREAHELSPAMGVIALALADLPNLGSIDLSSNALGPSVEGPVVYLAAKHTPLQELNLNDTGMGPETGVAIANALVSLAAKKADAGAGTAAPPLRSLLLTKNKLCQDDDDPMAGMEEWAAALAAHPRLTTVALLSNRIQHAGMAHIITHGLARLRELEVLDLADNTFTARGKEHTALAEAVPNWPNLRVLDLDESLLGSRGAALLFAALASVQPSRLESLKLKMNNLSPENMLALAGVLWRLPELRELALDDNNFRRSDEGYQMLVRLMRQRGEERGIETSVDEVGRRRYSAPSLSPNSTRAPPPPESESSSSGSSSQSSSP